MLNAVASKSDVGSYMYMYKYWMENCIFMTIFKLYFKIRWEQFGIVKSKKSWLLNKDKISPQETHILP